MVLDSSTMREACGIYELLLTSGATKEEARAKVVELYSPPRVTTQIGCRFKGLGSGGHLRPLR